MIVWSNVIYTIWSFTVNFFHLISYIPAYVTKMIFIFPSNMCYGSPCPQSNIMLNVNYKSYYSYMHILVSQTFILELDCTCFQRHKKHVQSKKQKSSDAGFSPFSLESPWKICMQVQEHLEMW